MQLARSSAPDVESAPTIDPRIAAAAGGDRAAAQALLFELLPRVRNLVRYLMRGDRDVDDVAQDALIAVLRGLGSYRGEGPFEAWVDRTVARTAFAHARRRTRARADEQRSGPELRLFHGGATPPDEYAARRRAVHILDELPETQREAFVLHHVLGLSAPEVATETGVSMETVRSRLRLARARLRDLGLKTTGGDENGHDGS
jgi:RNA polymerase sigma-70 factor (ECF subfamily)